MAKSHAEFVGEMKYTNLEDNKKSQTKAVVHKDINYMIYQKQRMKNKCENWLQKRKEEGKDFSDKLLESIKTYMKRERSVFRKFYQEEVERAELRDRRIGIKTKDNDIMYEAKRKLYEWREKDPMYNDLAAEIEEFRYISDKPSQSIEWQR